MTTLTTEAVDTDRAAFYAAMGWDGGRVEVVAGTNQSNNPDKIDLITYDKATGRTTTRKWIAPDNVNGLEAHIALLTARWGNVYVSVGTYDEVPNRHHPGTMTHNREAPRPRRCFILDDVTDLPALRLPPTWATETSPANYQVGYTCTDLLSPKQAELLGEGAALLACTDGSGSDATQIIRVPGTLNTKYKCAGRAGDPKAGIEPEGWPVRLVFVDGPRYTPQQLATVFLIGGLSALRAANHSCSGKSEKATVLVDREMLARIPNGASLMNTPRYRALFSTRPQLVKLARGERVTLSTKYGPRASGSEQVAVLIANLITTGDVGPNGRRIEGRGAPPADEIRAVALFWHDQLRPGYDIGRYMGDVERLIITYQPAGYDPEVTKITSDIPSRQALLPPRKPGRPHGQRDVTTESLVAYITALPTDDDGYTRRTASTLANDLHISVPYVRLLLRTLRSSGRIKTQSEARTLAIRLIYDEGAFNYHPPLPLKEGDNLLSDEGDNSPSVDRIEMRNDADSVQGVHTPPVSPALPTSSCVVDDESLHAPESIVHIDVTLLDPESIVRIDATLYVEHGILAGEPDAMDEDAWEKLMAQRVPIGELIDPGAIAAWVVPDGLCEVPAEDLPSGDYADNDEARLRACRVQHTTRRRWYTGGSAMVTAQGTMEHIVPTHSVRGAIVALLGVGACGLRRGLPWMGDGSERHRDRLGATLRCRRRRTRIRGVSSRRCPWSGS